MPIPPSEPPPGQPGGQPGGQRGGQRFGRYVVRSQIGVGGMGVVYEALDTHLGRPVALKVVSSQYAGSPEFRSRFQREAATLARLDSPHIVSIFDHGEEEGQPWLATQLVRGGDLGQLLAARGKLPPRSALSVCAQVADALTDAHAAGVVHRDIKPSNVLVRDADAARLHAYLCDFGIALEETSDRLTTVGGVVGTWAYLAPERSQGAPATPASDIYALGCLLWACLTGSAPYAGTDIGVAMAHLNAPVRRFGGTDPLSRHLNEVLARTMAKDPAHRYASAEHVQEALASAPPPTAPLVVVPVAVPGGDAAPTQMSGSRPDTPAPPVAAAPPSWPPAQPPTMAGRPAGPLPAQPYRPSPPPGGPPPSSGGGSGRRWVAVVAAAVVVLLVVGGVVWVTRDDDDPPVADDPTTSGPTGSGSPTETTRTGPPPDDGSVRFDLDDDGDGDAVAIFQDGFDNLAVRNTYTSDGTTSFTTETEKLEVSEYPIYLDWNGDGTSETVEIQADTEAGSIELRSDDPTLDGDTFPLEIRQGYYVDTFAGDVDDDGDLDLVIATQVEPRAVAVSVLANEGDGFGQPAEWLRLPRAHQFTTSLATGDFDGDGKADLLTSLPTGTIDFDGTSTFYTGPRGTRLFSSTGTSFDTTGGLVEDSALEPNPLLVVGEFVDDGTPLLALAGLSTESPSTIRFYEVSAAGLEQRTDLTVQLAETSSFAATVRSQVSDVNGDGFDDLVMTKKVSETTFADISVALSDGTGFSAPRSWARPPPPCTDDLCFLTFLTAY